MLHDEKRVRVTPPAQVAEREASPSALDTATHTGKLALAIGEYATTATSKEALARELAALLSRELGPANAAWFWCEQQLDENHRPQLHLKRAVITRRGELSARAPGKILRTSAEAAAASRHLILRSG